jgi:thiamine biosynthesis protein ThiI
MDRIILIRYEEIFLKGSNRWVFEKQLMDNMKKTLQDLGTWQITRSQSRIFVEPSDGGVHIDEAVDRLTRVFGINSVCPCWKLSVDFQKVSEVAIKTATELFAKPENKTFKVITRRQDKKFPMSSMEISAELGAILLDSVRGLKVDVVKPDFTIHVEMRESAYVYSEIVRGAGGLPTGTGGKCTLLLSGGIDSPVAGWMIAKRGVEIEAVHFYSYPYTSERARDKVLELAKILATWCIHVKVHIVPFTEIQLEMNEKCPSDYSTILMRRYMMRIAERIAIKSGSLGLITGEAIGQVASQTLQGLQVTDAVVGMPIFRPCIGMDKNEVIDLAKRIGTFETSILPYEDCCTVFVAKHPVTKPTLEKAEKFEKALDMETLIEKALAGTEVVIC